MISFYPSAMTSTPPFILPTAVTLEATEAVKSYLMARGLAGPGDRLELERPGASNMNCVWRARLPGRSLIIKQARAWVEKYPAIAAPVERAEAEVGFYRCVSRDNTLRSQLPLLLFHDPQAHLLVMSDLAPALGLERCYDSNFRLSFPLLDALSGWLQRLHALTLGAGEAATMRNRVMRELNHAHIFDLPLRRDGPFDATLDQITPGLAEVARRFRENCDFAQRTHELGQSYLADDGSVLIHGDFFPGSILLSAEGQPLIIDPEFSFAGDPEWDVGVFQAHLILSGHSREHVEHWETMAASRLRLDWVRGYAGVEVMRRLIGIAQLPLQRTLEEKRALLAKSESLVLGTYGPK